MSHSIFVVFTRGRGEPLQTAKTEKVGLSLHTGPKVRARPLPFQENRHCPGCGGLLRKGDEML